MWISQSQKPRVFHWGETSGEAINSLQNLRQKIEDLERELAEAERSFNLERAGQIKQHDGKTM